ncbi:MAG: AfsR/SARP family transcriptional regulator, partial [Mycobacteriales bacterium]
MVTSSEVSSTAPRLHIAVLGPLRAWRDGAAIELGPVRQLAFLAALVLRAGRVVGQQELLEDVWGSEPPGTGGQVIPGYVYRLRKCLQIAGEEQSESPISRVRLGYRFSGDGVVVDSIRLDELAREATATANSGDLAAAVTTYSSALGMFEGEPLTGLPGPFAMAERRRLAERKLALQQAKAEGQLRLGQYDQAIGELSALTATNPHSEPLAALLMRSLHGSGRRADALAVYSRTRRRLIEDLGVEPGDELRRVQQAVFRENIGPPVVPPRPTPGDSSPTQNHPRRQIRNDLPAGTKELIGRDRELVELMAPVDAAAVSVHAVDGGAGAGKTVLAVHAARQIRDLFADGCLFVDLRGHVEGREPLGPERALRRLLRAVGANDSRIPDDIDELAASWRAATDSLRLLLVLDDASSAEQVRPLLPAGAGSRVLVTSRRRLVGLEADRRISVGPLEPAPAEELLTRLVGENRAYGEPDAVRELARLCDWLPLALRVAGARLQNRPTWTFEYLVSRLADDERRLGELTAADRSVEAAFQLSYDQLSATEQLAFRVLGRCPTVVLDRLLLAAMLDWPQHEAERVLESLVDASLVQQPSAGRYRLHDLVGAYARRLTEKTAAAAIAAVQTGALRLYLTIARYTSDPGPSGYLTGPEIGDNPCAGWKEAVDWLDAAGSELTDVVAHAVAIGQVDYACWIAEALVDYLIRQDRYHECRTVLETVLPFADDIADPRMASSLRICLGIAFGLQGHYGQASEWFLQALEIGQRSGDPREHARALGALGAVAAAMGRLSEAEALLNEALELAGPLNDDWLIGTGLGYVGYIYHKRGQYAEALECFAESLARAEKVGTPRPIIKVLCAIAGLRLDLGECAEASELLRHAVQLAEAAGDRPLLTFSLARLGAAEQGLGHL